MGRNCTARKVYKLTIEGPDADNEKAFIKLADQLSLEAFGEGLDSLDIGDSMGAFIRLHDAEMNPAHGIGDNIWAGNGITVTMSTDWELFDWDKPHPTNTLGDLVINPDNFNPDAR